MKKNVKRFLATAMATTVATSACSFVANAETTTVSYEVNSPSYTLTVPSTLTAGGTVSNDNITLSITTAPSSGVDVTVGSTSVTLTHSTVTSCTCTSALSLDGSAMSSTSIFSEATETKTAKISAGTPASVPMTGSYSGTITYTAGVHS